MPVEDHEEWARKIEGFHERTKVVPGLTGPAQLLADRLSRREWLRYDLAYIEKMSPWLDLKIVLLSALVTILGRWDRRGARALLKWGLKEFVDL